MTDMMHSTTAIVLMSGFLLLVVSALFITVRVAGGRAQQRDEQPSAQRVRPDRD